MMKLISIQRICFLVAVNTLAAPWPRYGLSILKNEQYLEHCEGLIPRRCLRVGQSRKFVGKELCRQR